jgi:predicted metal-dependent HD superfamily phosphohydrolase
MGMGLGLLKEMFTALLHEYTSDTNLINTYWQEIEKAYSNKDRHYHTLAHLENMLKELIEVRNQINDWNTVLFSLYYHDIVYNALKNTNEEQSAELAQKRMQTISIPTQAIENCYQQIIATQKHMLNENKDTNFFIDADLSILGKDWFFYEQYTQRVRKEYGIYPDFVYNPGRKKVLNHFLDMERIFKTDEFFDKYESKARQNLLREITLLSV